MLHDAYDDFLARDDQEARMEEEDQVEIPWWATPLPPSLATPWNPIFWWGHWDEDDVPMELRDDWTEVIVEEEELLNKAA